MRWSTAILETTPVMTMHFELALDAQTQTAGIDRQPDRDDQTIRDMDRRNTNEQRGLTL